MSRTRAASAAGTGSNLEAQLTWLTQTLGQLQQPLIGIPAVTFRLLGRLENYEPTLRVAHTTGGIELATFNNGLSLLHRFYL